MLEAAETAEQRRMLPEHPWAGQGAVDVLGRAPKGVNDVCKARKAEMAAVGGSDNPYLNGLEIVSCRGILSKSAGYAIHFVVQLWHSTVDVFIL